MDKCEHARSCIICEHKDCDMYSEPCNKCFRIMRKEDRSNFKCAICKKEKATGEMANSK